MTSSHLDQGIIVSLLLFCVKFESKRIKFKLYTHVHNTARTMIDVNRDGYRDQIVSMSVRTLPTEYVMFSAFHNTYVDTIHCMKGLHTIIC